MEKKFIGIEVYLKELLMLVIVIALSLIPIGINTYILNRNVMSYHHYSLLNIILFVVVMFLAYIWSKRSDCKVIFTIVVSLIIIGVESYIMTSLGCDFSGTAKCTSDVYLSHSIGMNIIIYVTIYILVYILGIIGRKLIK